MFYSYENTYISEVTLLVKGPPLADSMGNSLCVLLISTLFCFSYNRHVTLVCDVGAERSLKASRLDHGA